MMTTFLAFKPLLVDVALVPVPMDVRCEHRSKPSHGFNATFADGFDDFEIGGVTERLELFIELVRHAL